MNNLIRNAIQTPDGTILESTYRHDYKSYTDANGKNYMVDGGLDYVRRSANGDEIDLCIYDDAPHAIQASILKWGTYGINQDQPLKYVTIAEMDTAHIEAVLELNVNPTLKACMVEELQRRLPTGFDDVTYEVKE
jgi:hypothetical protein